MITSTSIPVDTETSVTVPNEQTDRETDHATATFDAIAGISDIGPTVQ